VEADIFDMLAPFAREFESEAQAFKFVCLAQKEGHGWSSYWYPKPKALARWEIIRRDSPDRWKEFLVESSRGNEFGFPARRIHQPQVPLAVEFLIYFGQMGKAEVLCEASVRVAEGLMANLRLPPVDWLNTATETDLYDVLFARIVWPSPIVRERAASQISELLANEATRQACLTRICGWLSEQKLESKAVVGLLPVAKAARRVPLGDGTLAQRLRNSIKARSIVSENILLDIERHL
jgi:hypothetical protein